MLLLLLLLGDAQLASYWSAELEFNSHHSATEEVRVTDGDFWYLYAMV